MLERVSECPSFLGLNTIPGDVCTTLSSRSSIAGHPGYFYLLVIVNYAAMNVDVQVSESLHSVL